MKTMVLAVITAALFFLGYVQKLEWLMAIGGIGIGALLLYQLWKDEQEFQKPNKE